MFNKQFNQLHHLDSPLLLGNVWDVNSALTFQKLGFKAIGTSSAAIANSLGYQDGEEMPFKDLIKITKNIQDNIRIPLTVDIESGYSNDIEMICKNIHSLAALNIAGINIEDSIVNNQRKILEAKDFGEKIHKIKRYLCENKHHIFINVRTDSFIMDLDNPLEETIKRVQIYEKSGADGIFVPCLVNEQDIKKVVESTSLPLNVMTMPALSDFNTLSELGVKRISTGPFVYNKLNEIFENTLSTILKEQSFNVLFQG